VLEVDQEIAEHLWAAEHALEHKDDRPDFASTMFEQQLIPWACHEDEHALLWGRRGGKTEYIGRWLYDGCYEQQGSAQLYLAQTHDNARLILWPTLKWLDQRFELGCTFDNSRLWVTCPNGSMVLLGSWHDKQVIKKYRGGKPFKVAIDECGEIDDRTMDDLRDVIVGPSLADFQGRLCWSGTPGKIWHGPWFDMTGPEGYRTDGVPVFHGDMFHNPHIPHAKQWVENLLERRGWTWDTPQVVIEYLGRWCEDAEELVLPWSRERNHLDELPSDLPRSAWRFCLGVDVGSVDNMGWALWGSHPNYKHEVLFRSWESDAQTIDQVAADIRHALAWCARFVKEGTMDWGDVTEWIDKPSPCVVVMDTGGMGKWHATEIGARFAVPIIAAEKRHKLAALRVYRDRLRTGGAKFLAGPQNDTMRSQCATLRWNDRRDDIEKDQPDHSAHAGLYSHRSLCHRLYTEQEKEPEHGSRQWQDAEDERMLQREIERVHGGNDVDEWRE